MKENKVTSWLFNLRYKTRIKEVFTISNEGITSKYYLAQYRTFELFPWYWCDIYTDVDFSNTPLSMYTRPNTLEYEKLKIGQWVEAWRKHFFTTTKVEYIKYP